MGQPGDINDELDDDSLRKSIESSTRSGEWRNDGSQFDDPRLQSLAKQLAEPPRSTYTERRLLELDRRAAEKAQRDEKARRNAEKLGDDGSATAASDWRSTIVKPGAPAAPNAPAAERQHAAANALAWASSLGAAFGLFAAALAAQIAIEGWQTSLGVRAAIAALATGIAWRLFGASRYRSAAIAGGAHLIAFVGTGSASSGPEVFAAFLGAMIVALGGGALGMARER